MKEKGGLHILDALENLNTLVDADSLEEIEVTDDNLLVTHKGDKEGRLVEDYWVKAGPDDQTVQAIKSTFRSVYSYLQVYYGKMKDSSDTKHLVEGINTIMVLVGEAAKKMEKFGALFKERVVDFKEYKELQDFYRNRVIHESFQDFMHSSLPLTKKHEEKEDHVDEEALHELLEEEEISEVAGTHLLNDLELIKRDHLYELFYLKNEAGHQFYTSELARNIKLACDFGGFTEEYFGDDPLLQIKNWEDKSLHLQAKDLLKTCSSKIEKFYREAMRYKEMEVVACVHDAIMALMLASNPRNLIRQFSLKGSHLYMRDFLLFLHEALFNREYQKFLIYSPPSSVAFFQDLFDLVHTLCYHLFTQDSESDELSLAIQQMVQRAEHKKTEGLSQLLTQTYDALNEVLIHHPNGPVFKAVDIVRQEGEEIFDPLHQGNLPAKEWSLRLDDRETKFLRIPCPTQQEHINRAYVAEEFKTFLRAMGSEEHLLFVNYQDRTSWKEHARCQALEELSRQAEFANLLTVVTLAKDTEFYNQVGYYEEIDEAQVFIEQFIHHLKDESTGYYFPPKLRKVFFPQFISKLLSQIHRTFFENKTHLSFLERLDFIEIAYHFIELKLIEEIKPAFAALSSKDALDIAGTAQTGLIALLTIAHGKKWKEEEGNKVRTILFGPTLLHRERIIHPERFERLVSMIKLMETRGDYLKDFAPLFDKATLLLFVIL